MCCNPEVAKLEKIYLIGDANGAIFFGYAPLHPEMSLEYQFGNSLDIIEV